MLLSGYRVGVVFGGANAEHNVSVASARGVAASLERLGAATVLLGVDRGGAWHRLVGVDDLAGLHGAVRGPRDLLAGIDVVFPIIHGRGGEDGSLQGALEVACIPFVGSGVLASALGMDKRAATRMLSASGIPTIETRSVTRIDELPQVVRGMPLPLFIKPNRAGSSVGADRVDDLESLVPTVQAALREDDVALIQPLVVGREVSVGILEARGEVRASGASLLHLGSDQEFFSYAGKYGGGETQLEIPARLDSTLLVALQNVAVAAFEQLGCAGLARVDFFVCDDGSFVLNEINTLPGFSEQSHYPRLWRACGVEYDELVATLIREACVPEPAGAVVPGAFVPAGTT
ncbi:MAG: D-alanine--D-alanine ligase [Glaciihabitans sp.]|nr:D-alanine--D-alanine ligase [Glaciihabitans sp.]